jgi:uncharacterized protein YybS (DUF2232 family)
MRQSNTRPTVEAGVMSAIAIVFALITAYVPIIGDFVIFLWPVPIILLGVRHGIRWSVLATIASGLLSAILIQPLLAAKIVVAFGLIGLIFGHAFRAGFGPFKTIVWGSAACLVSKLASYALTFLLMGINPLNLQIEMLDQATTQAFDIYRNLGVPEEAIAQVQKQFGTMLTIFKVVIPAILALSAIFAAYINFILARAVLRRLGHPTPVFPPFKEWTFPREMLYFVIISVAAVFAGHFLRQELVLKIGLNLMTAAAFFLFGQGLALFYYLTDKYNLSRLIRTIILIMIFTNSIFQIVTVIAGALDLDIDYRQVQKPRPS